MTNMKIRSFSILLLPILVPALGVAQQTPQSLADAELPSLLAIYKDIHSHPELSAHEERTAAIIAKELRAAGCEVTENFGKYDDPKLKGYGVVGVMKNGDGPTVLVRTDMDALPVEEETGLPYASKVTTKNDEGKEVHVMHACGHDAHIAAFIGTARALAKLKDQWHGTIVFVGATGRGIGHRRARVAQRRTLRPLRRNRISRSVFMTRPICRPATSASPKVTLPRMSIRSTSPCAAWAATVPIRTRRKTRSCLQRKSSMRWQTIASRENNPLDPVVVTVGSIHGGTKHNIIPDEVKMQLTVRTYKTEVRERVLAAIERIAKGLRDRRRNSARTRADCQRSQR